MTHLKYCFSSLLVLGAFIAPSVGYCAQASSPKAATLSVTNTTAQPQCGGDTTDTKKPTS